MNYKKSYYILLIGIWSGFFTAFAGLYIESKADHLLIGKILALIGLILMLGGIGQALLFYKCPNCGKRLNIRGKQPHFCPECGYNLNW